MRYVVEKMYNVNVARLMKKCDDSDCVGRMLLEIKQRLTELLPPKILAASSGEIKSVF